MAKRLYNSSAEKKKFKLLWNLYLMSPTLKIKAFTNMFFSIHNCKSLPPLTPYFCSVNTIFDHSITIHSNTKMLLLVVSVSNRCKIDALSYKQKCLDKCLYQLANKWEIILLLFRNQGEVKLKLGKI